MKIEAFRISDEDARNLALLAKKTGIAKSVFLRRALSRVLREKLVIFFEEEQKCADEEIS